MSCLIFDHLEWPASSELVEAMHRVCGARGRRRRVEGRRGRRWSMAVGGDGEEGEIVVVG